MTFDQIVADICGRMNLVSDEAIARVGQAVNRHYKRVTATIGLEPVRYVTRTAQTALDSDTVTFSGIEKIDRVFERDSDGVVRTLRPISVAQMRQSQEMQGDRSSYCVLHQSADTVTILLPGLALAITDLYADGWTTLAEMSGSDKPTLPESFHDILVFAVVAEEYLRKEKTDLADRFAKQADEQLRELRFHIADAPPIDWRQGNQVIGAEGGGGSGGSGSSVITGDIVFDRDPGPPFHVTPGSGKVENLDADKLDGQNSTDYHDAAQLTGTIDPARLPVLPPAPPLAHHASHEPGGSDALAALSADILTTGTLAPARIADDSLPLSKLPDVTAGRLLGRGLPTTGDPQEIVLGTGLAMNGATLSATFGNRSTFNYDYSSTLTEPPTSNQVRFDVAHPYTSIGKIWVRVLTTDGIDATLPLSLISKGTIVYVQDKNDSTLYMAAETTAATIVKSGYVELPVIWKQNGGALLNNQQVLFTIGTSSGSGGGAVATTPGGSNQQVQFNDGGVFGGDAGLVFDKSADVLTATGGIAIRFGANPLPTFGQLRFANASEVVFRRADGSSDLIAFRFDGSDAIVVGGVAYVLIQSHIYAIDATYDLGVNGLRFRDAWLSNAVKVGTNPALSGAIRLANAATIMARNAANTADVPLLVLDASNNIKIGSTGLTISPAGVLSGNGSGLTGVTATATPAGSTTQVQFNDGGAFAGDAGLVYDKATDGLTVVGFLRAGSGNYALSGPIRICAGQPITSRNWGNTSDVPLLQVNSSDQILIGSGQTVQPAGLLDCGGAIKTPSNLAIGNGPASTGSIRLSSTGNILGRNAAGTADITALQVHSDNKLYIGGTVNDAGLMLRSAVGIDTSVDLKILGNRVSRVLSSDNGDAWLGNATTEQSFGTYTVPAGLMSTNRIIRYSIIGVAGSYGGNLNLNFRIKLGGVTVHSGSLLLTGGVNYDFSVRGQFAPHTNSQSKVAADCELRLNLNSVTAQWTQTQPYYSMNYPDINTALAATFEFAMQGDHASWTAHRYTWLIELV